jgi:hypothetical protein
MTQNYNIGYSHLHFTKGNKGKISLKNVMKNLAISKHN